MTPYCKQILFSMLILLRIVKLMKAEETAPKEDIKTRIAAQVPRLSGCTQSANRGTTEIAMAPEAQMHLRMTQIQNSKLQGMSIMVRPMHMIPYKLMKLLPLRSARYPKTGADRIFTRISKDITITFLKFSIVSFFSILNFCCSSIGWSESTLTKINDNMKQ